MPFLTTPLTQTPDSCEKPKKQNEIEEQLSFCDKQAENLASRIGVLEGKLSPVLRRIPEEENVKKDALELTPLANSIRKIGNSIQFFTDKLQSIINRLEL